MPWRAPNKNPMHERQDMKDNDSGKLIAIVEDDPDVAKIIEQVLGDFFKQHQLQRAQTGVFHLRYLCFPSLLFA